MTRELSNPNPTSTSPAGDPTAAIPSSWSLMAGASRLHPFPKAPAADGLACGTPSHGLGCACKGKRKPGDPAEFPYAASSQWPAAAGPVPPQPSVLPADDADIVAAEQDAELGKPPACSAEGAHDLGCPAHVPEEDGEGVLARKASGLGCSCKKGKKKNQPPEYVPPATPEIPEAERVPVFGSAAFAPTEKSRMDAAGMPRYLPYGDSTEMPGRVPHGPAFLGAGPLGMPTLPPYPTTKCPPVPGPIPPPTYARPGTTFWPRATPCGQRAEAKAFVAGPDDLARAESARKFLALAEGAAHLMERAARMARPFASGRARHIALLARECMSGLGNHVEDFQGALKELRAAVGRGEPAKLTPEQLTALDRMATCAVEVETAARNQAAADAGIGAGVPLLSMLLLL